MTKKQQLKYEAAEQYLLQKGYYWDPINTENDRDHIDILFSLTKNDTEIKIPTEKEDSEIVDLLCGFSVDIHRIEYDSYEDGFDWEYGSQFGTETWTAIENVDASDAVAFSDQVFWGENSEEIDYADAISKISKLFGISEEEFKQDLEYVKLSVEYYVIQQVQEYYSENPDDLPEPDNDWYYEN